jgi:hypothetical protein
MPNPNIERVYGMFFSNHVRLQLTNPQLPPARLVAYGMERVENRCIQEFARNTESTPHCVCKLILWRWSSS